MAKFFNSAANMISNALSKNTDPNQVPCSRVAKEDNFILFKYQVKEVASTQFNSWPVRRRDDCLLLYGPYVTEKKSDVATFKAGDQGGGEVVCVGAGSYELVVQSDRNFNYCFSVFRTVDVSQAEARQVTILIPFLS